MASIGDKLSVLVVDDEEDICELITAFLSTTPFFGSIVTAKDGVEAINKMANQDFDLIILDHFMPKKTGLEFAELLKTSARKKPKVVMISGALSREDVMRAVMAGIKSILVKPFNRKQLIDMIKKELGVSL